MSPKRSERTFHEENGRFHCVRDYARDPRAAVELALKLIDAAVVGRRDERRFNRERVRKARERNQLQLVADRWGEVLAGLEEE